MVDRHPMSRLGVPSWPPAPSPHDPAPPNYAAYANYAHNYMQQLQHFPYHHPTSSAPNQNLLYPNVANTDKTFSTENPTGFGAPVHQQYPNYPPPAVQSRPLPAHSPLTTSGAPHLRGGAPSPLPAHMRSSPYQPTANYHALNATGYHHPPTGAMHPAYMPYSDPKVRSMANGQPTVPPPHGYPLGYGQQHHHPHHNGPYNHNQMVQPSTHSGVPGSNGAAPAAPLTPHTASEPNSSIRNSNETSTNAVLHQPRGPTIDSRTPVPNGPTPTPAASHPAYHPPVDLSSTSAVTSEISTPNRTILKTPSTSSFTSSSNLPSTSSTIPTSSNPAYSSNLSNQYLSGQSQPVPLISKPEKANVESDANKKSKISLGKRKRSIEHQKSTESEKSVKKVKCDDEDDPYCFEAEEESKSFELTRFGSAAANAKKSVPGGPVYKFKNALLTRESRTSSTESRSSGSGSSSGGFPKSVPLNYEENHDGFLDMCDQFIDDLQTKPISVSRRPSLDAYRERLAARKEKNANRGRKKKSDIAELREKESDIINEAVKEVIKREEEKKAEKVRESEKTSPKKSPGRKKKQKSQDNNNSDDVKPNKKGSLLAFPMVPKPPQKLAKKNANSSANTAGNKTNQKDSKGVDLCDVWRQAFGAKSKKGANGSSAKVKEEVDDSVKTYLDIPPEVRRKPRPNFGGLIHFAPDWEHRVRLHHENCRIPSKVAKAMLAKPKILTPNVTSRGSAISPVREKFESAKTTSKNESSQHEVNGDKSDVEDSENESKKALEAILDRRKARSSLGRMYKVFMRDGKKQSKVVAFDKLPEEGMGLLPTPGLPMLTPDTKDTLIGSNFGNFRRQTLLRYLEEHEDSAELKAKFLDWKPEVFETKTRRQSNQIKLVTNYREIFGIDLPSHGGSSEETPKKKGISSSRTISKTDDNSAIVAKTPKKDKSEKPSKKEKQIKKKKVDEEEENATLEVKVSKKKKIVDKDESSSPEVKVSKKKKLVDEDGNSSPDVKVGKKKKVSEQEEKTKCSVEVKTPKKKKIKDHEEKGSSEIKEEQKVKLEELKQESTDLPHSQSTSGDPINDDDYIPTEKENELQTYLQTFALDLLDDNLSWANKKVIQNLVIWEPIDGALPILPEKRGRKKTKKHKKRQSGMDFSSARKKSKMSRDVSRDGSLERETEEVHNITYSLENVISESKSWVIDKGAGETILHRAAKVGHPDVVAYALDIVKMPATLKDNAGIPPIHKAAYKGHSEVVDILLKYGVDPNTNVKGTRPLHEALESGNPEAVYRLLRYGSDPLLYDYSGNMPIDLTEGDDEMRLYLSSILADLHGKEGKRWNVSHDQDFVLPPDLSNKEEEESDDDDDDFIFEVSSQPLPPHFKFPDREGHYVLVSDLKQKPDPKKMEVIEMTWDDFSRTSKCCLLGQNKSVADAADKQKKVRLVRLTEDVKRQFGVEGLAKSNSPPKGRRRS